MGKQADREEAIMVQLIELHKKMDYITEEVSTKLDKILNEVGEDNDDDTPSEEGAIQSINII